MKVGERLSWSLCLHPESEHIAEPEPVNLKGVATGCPNQRRDVSDAPADSSRGSPLTPAETREWPATRR